MNFFDHASKSFGIGCGVSKFNSLGFPDIHVESEAEDSKTESETKSDSKSDSKADSKADGNEEKVSDHDISAIKEIAKNLASTSESPLESRASAESVLSKWSLPVRSLSLSPWNPVPQHQALKGDLLYLTLSTLEGDSYTITCHASGFFVSRLSNMNFNPAIKVNEKGVSHKEYLLFNLVAKLSPKFESRIINNKEALYKASQFPESYLIPSQIYTRFPWAVTSGEIDEMVVPDYSRTQVSSFSNGTDGADLVKDWNDEFQGIKEFPRESFNERLLRDKLLSKYIHEFNQTAVPTAMDIVKGNLAPLNPNEDPSKHIFLRNNIFYSFGVNATGSHDATGGDEAARYCFAKDLATVKLMNRIDASGVCNLLTCMVDFMGERVICQAPVAGVLNDQVDEDGNSIDKVLYGFSLEENRINMNEKFESAFQPISEAFHLSKHSLELSSGASTGSEKLVVSKDMKGIKGTDGRKYIIDLYRSTPLDIDFLDAHYSESESSYPHKEASIRHEAVEEWYKRKAAAIFKVETEKLEQNGVEGEKTQIAIPYDQITFNPDAFTGVNDSDEDKNVVREISELVKKHLIPEFLNDVSQNAVPYDGCQLSDYLHNTGINMRYLGLIAEKSLERIEEFKSELDVTVARNDELIKAKEEANEKAKEEAKEKAKEETEQSEEKTEQSDSQEEKKEEPKQESKPSEAKLIPVIANMTALNQMCVQEMIVRATKHILRKEGKNVPTLLKPHFVAHIHNCLLGEKLNSAPEVSIDESLKPLVSEEDLKFTKLSPKTVQELIAKEVFLRFRFTLPEGWVTNIKSIPFVREVAFKYGIQWKAQTYFFTKEEASSSVEQVEEVSSKKSKKSKRQESTPAEPSATVAGKSATTFVAEDIVAFVPVTKDSSYRCSLVDEIFETARVQIKTEDKQVGLDLLAELVSFYQQIYGSVHIETANFYSTLARIYSECGMNSEASIVSRKAIILQERLNGVDSYETINSYVKSSFFESLKKDYVSSFQMNSKALADWTAIYGEDHPNAVSTYSKFASVFQELKLLAEARQFYEKALDLSVKFNGEFSDVTAVLRYRFGVLLLQSSEYQLSLEQFSAAADVLKRYVGPEDVFSVECSTLATSVKNFLVFTERKEAEQKQGKGGKLAAAAAAAKAKSSASKAQNTAQSKKGSSKKGKKATVPNPDIASKSIEEILSFIEGKLSKKSKN